MRRGEVRNISPDYEWQNGQSFLSHGFLRFLTADGELVGNCPAVAVARTFVAFSLSCTAYDSANATETVGAKVAFVQIDRMRQDLPFQPGKVRDIPGFFYMATSPVSELVFFGSRAERLGFASDPLTVGDGPTIGLARLTDESFGNPSVSYRLNPDDPSPVLDFSYDMSCRYWLHDSMTAISDGQGLPLTVDETGCGFDIQRQHGFIPGYVSTPEGAFRIRRNGMYIDYDGFGGFFRPRDGKIVAVSLSRMDLDIISAARRGTDLPELAGRIVFGAEPFEMPDTPVLFLSNRCGRDARLTVYGNNYAPRREGKFTVDLPAGSNLTLPSKLSFREFDTIGFAFDNAPNGFPYARISSEGRQVPAVTRHYAGNGSFFITVPC